jgi:hypothetical protein
MNSDKPHLPTHAAVLYGGVDSIMRANSKKINDNSETRKCNHFFSKDRGFRD